MSKIESDCAMLVPFLRDLYFEPCITKSTYFHFTSPTSVVPYLLSALPLNFNSDLPLTSSSIICHPGITMDQEIVIETKQRLGISKSFWVGSQCLVG